MTEAEWNAAEDPQPMLLFLRKKASARKCRLFALACVRRIERHLDGRCRAAVAFAERFAEVGLKGRRGRPAIIRGVNQSRAEANRAAGASKGERTLLRAIIKQEAAGAAYDVVNAPEDHRGALICSIAAAATVYWVSRHADDSDVSGESGEQAEKKVHADLLRDLLGPLPFRKFAIDPDCLAWEGGTVRRLAEGIYDDAAFDRLPVLADALEEAGCTNEEVLAHCRSPGPHVRGCWVVDLLLAKA